MISTKSLYTQIVSLIEKKSTRYATGAIKSESKVSRSDADMASMVKTATTDDVVAAMSDILAHVVEPRIITGLEVTATSPASTFISISSGTGTAGGKYYTLNTPVTININFNKSNSVYFINLYSNGVRVESKQTNTGLTIAKIIVPNPSRAAFITDKKDDLGDAYIQSFKKYNLYGINDKFEEDSIDLLRSNIGEILADNLIGNLRLSENLKITNTSGSLELDSSSVKIYSSVNQLMAKFNQRGTYFYNQSGSLVSKFSVDGATIGNIVINPSNIRSKNFVSGLMGSGFQITDAGEAEFNNVTIRGALKSSVFETNTVSTVGGSLLVLDGDILSEDMTILDDSKLVISGATTFAVNDILRIKEGVNEEWFIVTNNSESPIYIVDRDRKSDRATNNKIPWSKGTAVVNYGSSGSGGIYMTASDVNGPNMSIFTHSGSPWNTINTYIRLGNLNGFLGYSSNLFGIGIGDLNNYLKYDSVNGLQIKGSVTITGGNAAITFSQEIEPGSSGDSNIPKTGDIWFIPSTGKTYIYDADTWNETSGGVTDSNGMINVPATPSSSGLYLGSSFLGYYNGDEWGSYIKSDGTFYFGGPDLSGQVPNHIRWDGSILSIRGSLNAEDIITGYIDADRIRAGSIIASHIYTTNLAAISADLGNITAGNISGTTITGGTIQTASSGARTVLNSTNLIAYDDAAATIFNIILSGANVGDVLIGDYANNKGIFWDKSAGTFNVKGAITASSGSFTGAIYASSGNFSSGVSVGSGVGSGSVTIDGTNQCITVHDGSAVLRVKLGKLS
jgi:hypothetical protein